MEIPTLPETKPALMTPWLVFATLVACLLIAIAASAMLGISMPRSGWYFPPESVTDHRHGYYRAYLDAMREPRLRAGTGSRVAAMRILCVTSFGHAAAVRYTFDEGGASRRAVQLQGYGAAAARIEVDRTDRLTRAQANALLASLDAAGYWNMATNEENTGLDGLRIIVEATRGSDHRVVDRWSPSYDTNERDLAGYRQFYRAALDEAGVGRRTQFGEQVCVE
jgi:hypothetical protein